MDTFEVIRARRSIRAFKPKKIPDEILYAILEAGHCAPAAGNICNWRFLLIEEEPARKLIAKAALKQDWIAQAPAIIIVCADNAALVREYGKQAEKLYATQNVACAIENILLAAQNFGIASCWIGAFTEANLRKEFKIPDSIEIHAIIPLGYADEKPMPPSRPAFADVSFFDKYGELERGKPPRPLGEHVEEAKGKLAKEAKKVLKSAAEKVKKKK